jgi:hypothetical protein
LGPFSSLPSILILLMPLTHRYNLDKLFVSL